MAWKERSRMHKAAGAGREYLKGEKPMTELCLEYGVAGKTGYKWVSQEGNQACFGRACPRMASNRRWALAGIEVAWTAPHHGQASKPIPPNPKQIVIQRELGHAHREQEGER